jgi:hypothetical protein
MIPSFIQVLEYLICSLYSLELDMSTSCCSFLMSL